MKPDYLRLRQVCLVAPELAPAERVITDVLGLTVCYRDPNVAKYGLENALWPIGDMFLEVVAPTKADTAAGRFLARSGGRGGYMVIFDCSDPHRRAIHARDIGIRVVTEITHDNYTGVQLHPRDCRAAMIEFNRTEGGDHDPDLYAPAGPDWRRAQSAGKVAIRAIELSSCDPDGLARHWARIIETRPVDARRNEISFLEAVLRFVDGQGTEERVDGIVVAMADTPDVLARAERAGLERTARGFRAVGVEWILAAA